MSENGRAAADVFEFFLQTLVKKGYLHQGVMIGMQQLLMAVSTYAALRALDHVRASIAMLSLFLNLCRRGNDVTNCAALCLLALLSEFMSDHSTFCSTLARAKIGIMLSTLVTW